MAGGSEKGARELEGEIREFMGSVRVTLEHNGTRLDKLETVITDGFIGAAEERMETAQKVDRIVWLARVVRWFWAGICATAAVAYTVWKDTH